MLKADWQDIIGIAISVVGAAALAVVLYRRTSPTLPFRMRFGLGLVRWSAAFLMLLLVTDPVLHLVRTRLRRPLVVIMIDDSKSMAYPDQEAKLGQIKTVLSREFWEDLGKKSDLRIFTFSDRVVELAPDEIPALTASGSRTDLVGGIRAVSQIVGSKPSAFVILSDGAVNFGEDVLHSTSALGVPINTVWVGGGQASPDLCIDRLEVEPTAYANSQVTVGIVLSGNQPGPVDSQLRISDSLGTVYNSGVSVPGNGAKTRLTAKVGAGEIGVHDFAVSLSQMEGEAVTVNNSASFSLKVVKGKTRVCLVASRPSWDFAFARRALEGDPGIEVSIYFTPELSAPVVLKGAVTDLGRVMSELDVMVVVDNASLGSAAGRIKEFVWGGGGLLLVAADPSQAPYSELGPFTPASSQPSGSLHYTPALTEIGGEHEILRLGAGGGFSWPDLPPVSILSGIGGLRQEAVALLLARAGDQTLPLLAVRRYGLGRVAAFSASDLWRWDFEPKGFGLEVSPFGQLLVNSVGWLTRREEIKPLALTSSKNTYLWGEPVDLLARVTDTDLKPVGGAVLDGLVSHQDSSGAVQEVVMADRGGGSYVARVDFLPPGRYLARVQAKIGHELYAEETTEFTIEERGLEDYGYEGDSGLLRELARSTGGVAHSVEDVDQLASELNPGMVVIQSFKELRLSLSPATFAVLAGLLGLEWLIRKRRMLL